MTSQWRYRNGAKLELIEPDPDYPAKDIYLARFLAKYGSRIHHITLKVPDLDQTVALLRRAGIEPIDINKEPLFHEAFVRPRDGAGILIQLLWTEVGDHEWENDLGLEVAAAPSDGSRLEAVRLRHLDLEETAKLWSVLGASVFREKPGLVARWPGSSLVVQIEPGRPQGPAFLVFSHTPSLPSHPRIGPAVHRKN